MDNFKDLSAEVLRIWEEENKVEEEDQEDEPEEESHQETLNSDQRCCELEYNKVYIVYFIYFHNNLTNDEVIGQSGRYWSENCDG